MIENAVHSVGGIAIFGIFSICLFFAFFIGMTLWASRLKKNYLKSMEGLPLEDGSENSTESHHE
jgi:hypothetical protein